MLPNLTLEAGLDPRAKAGLVVVVNLGPDLEATAPHKAARLAARHPEASLVAGQGAGRGVNPKAGRGVSLRAGRTASQRASLSAARKVARGVDPPAGADLQADRGVGPIHQAKVARQVHPEAEAKKTCLRTILTTEGLTGLLMKLQGVLSVPAPRT